MQSQQANNHVTPFNHETPPTARQNVIVHQVLQVVSQEWLHIADSSPVTLYGRPKYRGAPVAEPAPGGTLQEPANESDPQTVHEVATKHLPYTKEDEKVGDESSYMAAMSVALRMSCVTPRQWLVRHHLHPEESLEQD